MASIQFGGIASGIATQDIIQALMTAESQPLVRLQARRTSLEAQKTAYGRISTALDDLLAKARAFTVSQAGGSRSATSSNSTAFTATAAPGALVGQYQIIVDRLASATKATSTGAAGTALTDATATGAMSTLQLPGSVTAGQVSVVVDGTIVGVTVGDPATTSLKTVIDALAGAIQAQARTTDAGATVTAAIVDNKVRFTMSGETTAHAVRFGAGGDTSTLFGIVGLSGVNATAFSGSGPINGASALGVVRATTALDSAGLTGLTSTTSGTLTINGVAIGYDSTVDTLSTVISRINGSSAGVIASLDRTNDRIVLTNRSSGATAINIGDTSGTLGAALKLAPGTTGAQVFGQTAQVTVDGQVVISDSNRVTNAASGVSIDLLAQTTTAATLTVGPDRAATKKAVSDLVTSFNALADLIDSVAANTVGKKAGVLAAEGQIRGLTLDLRSIAMRTASALTGTIRSLGDIGVSSGAVGAAVGATRRLSLDEAKLDRVLDSDPGQVATLLNSADGAIQPLVTRLTTLTATDGLVKTASTGIDALLKTLATRETELTRRLDDRRIAIERRYTALETTMARLQGTASQLTAQTRT